MARVLIFSLQFPAYHPKSGEPTNFVEKFWKSILVEDISKIDLPEERENYCFNYHNLLAKNHTIRAGQNYKVGDLFSPRVWSGKPYRSPQIIIAPDTEVLKTWNVEIKKDDLGISRVAINGKPISISKEFSLCDNDGLSLEDFDSWFKKGIFKGQIVCWNDNVKY